MSELINPYAVSVLGSPLPQKAPPQLRAEGRPMTRPQLDMARFVFGRFLEQARLSYAPNPTQHGFLPDGSRFRIIDVAGFTTMQVWPVGGEEKRPVELPHGILLLYEGKSPEFVVVQYSPDSDGGSSRWRFTKVDKGRCGATMHPTNVKRDGVPVFALTNHGMYDSDIQTGTKFSHGGAISEPYSSGSGTFIVNGGVMECGLAAAALILDSRQMVFARMTEAGEVAFNTLAVPEIGRGGEGHLIQEPEEPEVMIDLLSVENDRVYAPMLALPNHRGVVVRFCSLWPNNTPVGVTTSFCYELLRIVDDVIPAHRLSPIPPRYDKEVWLNVHHDGHKIVVDKSIKDISQPARVVDLSILYEADETIDYFMVPWENTIDMSRETIYHPDTDAWCAGTLLWDWRAFDAPLPRKGVTPGGRQIIDLRKLTITASSDEDILLNSYVDFFGAVKEMRVNSKIKGAGISEYRYERVDRPGVTTGNPGGKFLATFPSSIILNEWGKGNLNWAEQFLQTVSSEIEYEAVLNVGGKEIDLAKIKGATSSATDWATGEESGGGGRDGFLKPNTIHAELSASVLCVLGFDKLSETIFGVRVIAESGGEKEISISYRDTTNGRTYFSMPMTFDEYFVVYSKGALVFERHLEGSVKLMDFSAFSAFPNNVKDSIPKEKIVRDEYSNDVYPQYYFTEWSADLETTSGTCPTYIYTPKESVKSWEGSQALLKNIHHAELDPSGDEFSRLSMAYGSSDIAKQLASASQATDYLPPRTMVAVDPISGSCAIVNDVCKILIDPAGNVTHIRDVTGLPDELLKGWCTST
ncbi:MAG: hypothetical protein PHE74_13120 [Comamonas sp.]|nr:hypothetical protein [Comamonas sp.]